MNLTLKTIAEWTKGKVAPEHENLTVTGVTTDSREAKEGELFVPLVGEHFDGHDYISAAMNRCAAVLSERTLDPAIPAVYVEDTLRAYGDLARGYRQKLKLKVIGITGSVGKTTTKEMIATVLGTAVNMVVTICAAYPLSRRDVRGRNFISLLFAFTMYFSGGLIPSYLLMKELNLFDTYAALILPGLVGTYNLVLIRNYFQSIPQDLEDACMIDGAGQFTTFIKIILPVSTPILATVALWLAVGHWNSWYDALLYMRSDNTVVLQTVLRRIILEGTQSMIDTNPSLITDTTYQPSTDGLKAATVYVATIPILCIYPFVQKYFVKGIMVGSLKG